MSLKIATESLSREEMRMITGGSGEVGCNMWSCSENFGCFQSNCCCSTEGVCVSRIGDQCP